VVIYNEIDPYPAQWMRNLDERSIADIRAGDIRAAIQFHTFAGIGVWSYALRLAGWSDAAPVWTGSCPCQPFSTAGKRKGESDDRHLWPVWRELIAECRPSIIFGEQVASADGRGWFSSVRSDLETLGYEVGAADLCAAGVGAPHVRQRIFFGARLANTYRKRSQGWGPVEGENREPTWPDGVAGRMGHTDSRPARRHTRSGTGAQGQGQGERQAVGCVSDLPDASGADGYWAGCDYISCTDGKARPVEPGTFPLAPRSPNHVGRIRAYGNSIVPQVAATFIRAFMDATQQS